MVAGAVQDLPGAGNHPRQCVRISSAPCPGRAAGRGCLSKTGAGFRLLRKNRAVGQRAAYWVWGLPSLAAQFFREILIYAADIIA